MATIKVKFRPSTRVDGEGAVYYQITHERSVKRLVSAHRLANDEWDHRRSAVRSRPGNSSRMDYLIAVSRSILRDVERLSEIIARFDSAFVSYTAADVATAFNRYMADFGLVNFMEGMITRLAERGRQRTSETYRATLRSFMKFRGGADLPLDTLSAEIMEDYQAWLTGRGVSLNTVSFYMRGQGGLPGREKGGRSGRAAQAQKAQRLRTKEKALQAAGGSGYGGKDGERPARRRAGHTGRHLRPSL